MVYRKELYRYAVDVFIELLKQITGRKEVAYRCDKNDISCWDNFITTFSNSIGEEFVRKFAEYGMNCLFNNKNHDSDYAYKVRFTWVFGKNQINRWKKSGINKSVYATRKGIKQSKNISLQNKTGEKSTLINLVRSQEEVFKGIYFNTKRGFLWCISNTTLYFHKSSWCVKCQFKNDCKKVLATEFPKMYELRGYGKE